MYLLFYLSGSPFLQLMLTPSLTSRLKVSMSPAHRSAYRSHSRRGEEVEVKIGSKMLRNVDWSVKKGGRGTYIAIKQKRHNRLISNEIGLNCPSPTNTVILYKATAWVNLGYIPKAIKQKGMRIKMELGPFDIHSTSKVGKIKIKIK